MFTNLKITKNVHKKNHRHGPYIFIKTTVIATTAKPMVKFKVWPDIVESIKAEIFWNCNILWGEGNDEGRIKFDFTGTQFSLSPPNEGQFSPRDHRRKKKHLTTSTTICPDWLDAPVDWKQCPYEIYDKEKILIIDAHQFIRSNP